MDLDENKSGVYINLLSFFVNLLTVVVERWLKVLYKQTRITFCFVNNNIKKISIHYRNICCCRTNFC